MVRYCSYLLSKKAPTTHTEKHDNERMNTMEVPQCCPVVSFAISTKFVAAQANLGRQWNNQIEILVANGHGHLVFKYLTQSAPPPKSGVRKGTLLLRTRGPACCTSRSASPAAARTRPASRSTTRQDCASCSTLRQSSSRVRSFFL